MPNNSDPCASESIDQLEAKLDSFNADERSQALQNLLALVESGDIELQEETNETNIHFHTFFSFNACDFSPTRVAWEAKKLGLAAAGIVDFDVFDGLKEFHQAARHLGLKASAGAETRVFVPEFAEQVINSPGEPGISYHMGTGFPSMRALANQEAFCNQLREMVANRNLGLLERVNAHLDAIALDYKKDVLTLTPAGNATERHICLAFAKKAQQVFSDPEALSAYWTEKLGTDSKALGLPLGRDLLNTIRAKTMKRGGVGYVQPDAGSFLKMAEFNAFVLAAGGIPTLAWLDGTSDGEQDMERLLDVAMSSGVAAVNIIPDRNYTPGLGESDEKCKNLYDFVKLAQSRDLPIIAGTEMNSPGQKLVDDFNSEELKPLTNVFLTGAYIVYAHTALQRQEGLGYTSEWAGKNFETTKEKNDFFETLGKNLDPNDHEKLATFGTDADPEDILKQFNS